MAVGTAIDRACAEPALRSKAFLRGQAAHATVTFMVNAGKAFETGTCRCGAKDYGPGVLEQQWKMSGLLQPEDLAVAAE